MNQIIMQGFIDRLSEKSANTRISVKYLKDADPAEIERASKRVNRGIGIGLLSGLAAGAGAGIYLGGKIKNPRLAVPLGVLTLLGGAMGGAAVGQRATRVPAHLRSVGNETVEETDEAPHKFRWKKYPDHLEHSGVISGRINDLV